MEKYNEVQRIHITLDQDNLTDGALKILKIIRPEWKPENIEFKQDESCNFSSKTVPTDTYFGLYWPLVSSGQPSTMKSELQQTYFIHQNGITNKLVGCNLRNGEGNETVLVRVYGNKTDLLIDRTAETRNILQLNNVGLAPRLYATFNNGLCYEYVVGCTLSEETVIKPEIYQLVAKRMAQLHKIHIPGEPSPTPVLWQKMQKFLDLVPDRFTDNGTQKRYIAEIVPKSQIQEEVNLLRERLTHLNSPVVFAHNDLLLGNVIYTAENSCVTFIDFEYAAFNYQGFDIGNHFAEFVGIDNVDYIKYPNKELQMCWLKAYLSELHEDAEAIRESQLEVLYVQANQFALASHVFWGIWALIQAEHSYIDFDFMGYAAIRLNEYFAKKEEFLQLEFPS